MFIAAQPALKISRLQMAPSLPPMGPGSAEAGIATLTAQPGGFLAWVQNLFGAGRVSTLTITNQRISRVDQAKNTRDSMVMPLSRASTFHYGFKKPPFALAVLGAIFFLLGVIMTASVGGAGVVHFAIAGACLAGYFLSKGSYYLIFASVGGPSVAMKLMTKDPAELDRMCDLAFDAVRASENGGAAVAYRAA